MNENNAKKILTEVYASLQAGGYNALRQLRDYLISGDPACISDVDGARTLIASAEREDLLAELLHSYLDA